MRLPAVVIASIVIAMVSAGGWAISRTHPDARAPLSQALDVLPAGTRVAGFTDWQQIRTTLGFDRITTSIDRDTLVYNSFERDLSARSILEGFAESMEVKFGWSVADLRWEMYGQSSDGALLAAGMNGDLKTGTVTAGLRRLGFASKDDIWSLDPAVLTQRLPGFPMALSNVAVLGDERLILTSDSKPYLNRALALHRDHGKSLAGVVAARQTAAPLLGAQSAMIEVKQDACRSTGLADESDVVRAQGRNAVKPFGALATVAYGGRAIFDRGGDERLRFSMTFESAAQATRQLKLRRALATGPFVGRSGQVEDVLTLRASHTSGSNATLDFGLDGDKGSFMSGHGPLLFAACAG